MVTTETGRVLFESQDKNIEDFFGECARILFDSGKNNHLIWVGNSPFVNFKDVTPSIDEHIINFYNKVNNSGRLDQSIAPGFPASWVKNDKDISAATSFGESNIGVDFGKEDAMLAFIGNALEVGLAGGQNFYFQELEILNILFEGWKVYRKLLNDKSTNLLPNKLASWNGQWLNYRLSEDYDEDYDFQSLTNEGFFKVDKKGIVAVDTLNWSELYFNLSQHFDNKLTPFMGSIGQKKETMGSVIINLEYCDSLADMYEHISGIRLKSKEFSAMFGLDSMRIVDTMRVSMKTLQPPKLEKMLNEQKAYKYNEKNFYQIKTYLLVMLGSKLDQVQKLVDEIATMLINYTNKEKNNTSRKNKVKKDLFGSNTINNFLEHIVEIIPDLDNSYQPLISDITKIIVPLQEPDFKMFILLLKLEFTSKEHFGKIVKTTKK
ncbi:hypothetical protein [Flammeovirga sp. OC4]|uniref:hypothetical protein n=1 Tax=Flammeovirga sp. OC4 TaxID=1382345 RepID=UPI0005C711D9|nr:hypothetical protein [Flammeovirga sp. OC4]